MCGRGSEVGYVGRVGSSKWYRRVEYGVVSGIKRVGGSVWYTV